MREIGARPRALLLARNDKWHGDVEDVLARQYVVPWLAEAGLDVRQTNDMSSWTRLALEDYQVFMPWLMPQYGGTEARFGAIPLEQVKREEADATAEFLEKGGAIFAWHGATVVPHTEPYQPYVDLLGVTFRGHPKYHEFEVRITRPDHPITRGLSSFRTSDELYRHDVWGAGIEVLAEAEWEGKAHPMAYTRRVGRGALYYLAPGHDRATWDHPAFKHLVVEGAKWLVEQTK